MLTFLTTKIWHHAHSTVTSSYMNSKETHASYDDVLFYENDKPQTEKMDKNKRWTNFTSFLHVANCDSIASIGVTLGLISNWPLRGSELRILNWIVINEFWVSQASIDKALSPCANNWKVRLHIINFWLTK